MIFSYFCMNFVTLLIAHFVTYFLVTKCVFGDVNKNLYERFDGLRCPRNYRMFIKTVYSEAYCVCMCSLDRTCIGVEYKPTGNLCYGCGHIYAVNSETALETSSTYFLDSEKETMIIQIRIGEDSGYSDRGRVEVRYNGTWGTVCDDRWHNHLTGHEEDNIIVMCRTLGFGGGGEILAYGSYPMANSTGVPIWMDNIECDGQEESIVDCKFSGFGVHDCEHVEDLSVQCYS